MSDGKKGVIILGGTGYVGGELLRLTAGHPEFELLAAVSGSQAGEPIAKTFAHLAAAYGDTCYSSIDELESLISSGDEIALFSAAPHGASASLVASVLKLADAKGATIRVVDSSADFRYPTADEFEAVYSGKHEAPELCSQFVCALPEHTDDTPMHVGHPGCFATAMLLATVPLAKHGLVDGDVFISAITGSTGSGRQPSAGTHHPVRHSNLYAYKPLAHRHVPEVENLVAAATGENISVRFVPHSGPFARGIHATVQGRLSVTQNKQDLLAVFADYYADAPFVDCVEGTPRLKDVVASNYARIGVDTDGDAIAVTVAIDNLVKGAAGGAVQWMNRLWGLDETAGLTQAAPAWT